MFELNRTWLFLGLASIWLSSSHFKFFWQFFGSLVITKFGNYRKNIFCTRLGSGFVRVATNIIILICKEQVNQVDVSRGPSTGPCGTPYIISCLLLQLLFILTLKLIDLVVTPYQNSLVISRLWSMQANTLERSVNKAPNSSPRSLD